MEVNKKQLEKSQIELTVVIPAKEFQECFSKGAEEISKEVKIEGFRQGNAPFDVVKEKVGISSILDKSARLTINKTLPEAMKEIDGIPIDQPAVDITKLSEDSPLEYKAVITLLPNVKLSDYKNFDIQLEKTEVNDEEIQNYIAYLQDTKAQEAIVDREIKEGDKVNLTLERLVDEKSIDEEGGLQNVNLVVGKDQIVKGFDEKLMGAKKGDNLEFSITYPEDSAQKQLAGKDVNFKVSIKEVYERKLPEVNNEFAKNLGFEDSKNLKESLQQTAMQEKEQYAERVAESKILEKIVKNSEFDEMPEILISQETDKMIEELEKELSSQGSSLDNYLSQSKKTKEQLKEELKPQAVKRIKTALAIREIIQKENIKVSNEEIEEKRNQLLEQYKGYEKAEEHIKKPEYADQLHSMLTNEKIMGQLKKWNLKSDSEDSNKKKDATKSKTTS